MSENLEVNLFLLSQRLQAISRYNSDLISVNDVNPQVIVKKSSEMSENLEVNLFLLSQRLQAISLYNSDLISVNDVNPQVIVKKRRKRTRSGKKKQSSFSENNEDTLQEAPAFLETNTSVPCEISMTGTVSVPSNNSEDTLQEVSASFETNTSVPCEISVTGTVSVPCVFSIKAIISQNFGLAVRRRSTKCKYINLKSFLKHKNPYVFTTKRQFGLQTNNLASQFNNFKLGENSNHLNGGKLLRKKFYPVAGSNVNDSANPLLKVFNESSLTKKSSPVPLSSKITPSKPEVLKVKKKDRLNGFKLTLPTYQHIVEKNIGKKIKAYRERGSSDPQLLPTPYEFSRLAEIITMKEKAGLTSEHTLEELEDLKKQLKKQRKQNAKLKEQNDNLLKKKEKSGKTKNMNEYTTQMRKDIVDVKTSNIYDFHVFEDCSVLSTLNSGQLNDVTSYTSNEAYRTRTVTNTSYQALLSLPSTSYKDDSIQSNKYTPIKNKVSTSKGPMHLEDQIETGKKNKQRNKQKKEPITKTGPSYLSLVNVLSNNLLLKSVSSGLSNSLDSYMFPLSAVSNTGRVNKKLSRSSSVNIADQYNSPTKQKKQHRKKDSDTNENITGTVITKPKRKRTRRKNKSLDQSSSSDFFNVTTDHESFCVSFDISDDQLQSPSKSENKKSEMRVRDRSGSNMDDSQGKRKSRWRKKNADPKLKRRPGKEDFEDYITQEEALSGVASGDLVKGFIRINPKNFKMAYVSSLDKNQQDLVICTLLDRNRALEGDEVVLQVKQQTEWQDGYKTAKVVRILNKGHPRTTVGKLEFTRKNTDADFIPRDPRFPILKIPAICWPAGFQDKPELFKDTLFVAKLTVWKQNCHPFGVLIEMLGKSGDLKVETAAILKECELDVTPFPPEYNMYLPQHEEIPEKEFTYREDFRTQCIFTIDPLTAKDLDDAVSCRQLPNGNYEVGVHISDASYYLAENTPLDKMVCGKATSIYFVDRVFHMLPLEMCLHCSLLPGKDKLAFSVIWEMTEEAEVISCKFTKSVINSCVQLAYEHAQAMIENPEKKFSEAELPVIHNGYTPEDLVKTVNMLQRLAVKMRECRFNRGALRIDQIKLSFMIHPLTGAPLEFSKQVMKDANRLIEEFMLLANISVARQINDVYPDLAFLRCHEPPKYNMLEELQRGLETFGIFLDISSSKGIRQSLEKYNTDDYFGRCRSVVLNHLLTKPMVRARYFCAGYNLGGQSHYALSVPMYTHFTSPIRRYADIMVHRLLAASLGYSEKPQWLIDQVVQIANNCNNKKYNAKKAGDMHLELYLLQYIDAHQPFIQDAVVVDVREKSYDLLVLETGSVIRLYLNKLEKDVKVSSESTSCRSLNVGEEDEEETEEREKKVWKHAINFPKTEHLEPAIVVIEIFSIIKVALSKVPKKNKLEAKLLRPVLNATCTGV